MQVNAESKGQLTVGGRDSRITNVGYFLRKFKLDELPQLFNVLNGTMSLVAKTRSKKICKLLYC
jgi:lipopolysaccharide/colanic/teichoic acid biosynthesis glycosyltransferase